MHKEKHLKAIELRQEGLTYSEISEQLGVAKSSVSLWCRNIVLTSEQQGKLKKRTVLQGVLGGRAVSEAARQKRRQYQAVGRQRVQAGVSDLYKFMCMLYWAEGSKSGADFRFTNTDSHMIKMCVEFLQKELDVAPESIAVSIAYHDCEDASINDIKCFWMNLLGLPACSWKKPSDRLKYNKNSSGFKKNKHPMGICTVSVHSVKIQQIVFGSIKELAGIQNDDLWLNKRSSLEGPVLAKS